MGMKKLDRTGGGAGVDWTLLRIENTAAQLTEHRGADGQGVSPE
ncbi:hypothetical protein [Streptomyces gobitricini]